MNYNSAYGVGNIGYDPYSVISQVSSAARSNSALSQAQAREAMAYSTESDIRAMDFSALEAAKNRDWQEYMSNTAHQREVQDLIAAGLNPVLSASGGNGASVGSGATASGFSSSGSQGQVDNALSSVIPQIYSQLLNAQVTLEGQKNNAAIAALDRVSNESIASAHDLETRHATDSKFQETLHSLSNDLVIQEREHEHDKSMRQKYPTTLYGFLSSLIDPDEGNMVDSMATKAYSIIKKLIGNSDKRDDDSNDDAKELEDIINEYDQAVNVAGEFSDVRMPGYLNPRM